MHANSRFAKKYYIGRQIHADRANKRSLQSGPPTLMNPTKFTYY